MFARGQEWLFSGRRPCSARVLSCVGDRDGSEEGEGASGVRAGFRVVDDEPLSVGADDQVGVGQGPIVDL
jgi:hypothetical protein